jgi:hypothetical protein
MRFSIVDPLFIRAPRRQQVMARHLPPRMTPQAKHSPSFDQNLRGGCVPRQERPEFERRLGFRQASRGLSLY